MLLVFLAFPRAGDAHCYDSAQAYSHEQGTKSRHVHTKRRSGMHNRRHNKAERLPLGTWAGEHITLEVNSVNAKVEYDCAHGTIDRKILLTGDSRFDVPGTHSEEHGGPVRENEHPDSYPARFNGQVKGKTMKLTVTRSDTKEIVGTFTLTHGAESSLIKCR